MHVCEEPAGRMVNMRQCAALAGQVRSSSQWDVSQQYCLCTFDIAMLLLLAAVMVEVGG
jgi:hypothetical protein